MEVNIISNAVAQREIAEARRAREEQVRLREQRDAERAAEVLQTEKRLAEDEARLLIDARENREFRRDLEEDARRLFALDREGADNRIDERLARRDVDIRIAFAENQATADFEPVVRNGEIVVPSAPAPQDPLVRQDSQVQLAPDDGNRFFEELQARDARRAERVAEGRDFFRQQTLDQVRAESNISQLTQPDTSAPRGAFVDLQA